MGQIKIELLDYVRGTGKDLEDALKATAVGTGWTANTKDKATFAGHTALSYLQGVVQNLVSGHNYHLFFRVSSYTGSLGNNSGNSLGFTTDGGVSANARLDGNGTYSEEFTSDGANLKLFGRATNTGIIKDISVYDLNAIDWEQSVVGELDVSSHEDFPLALTFSIADIENINTRKGSFSKTFKLPATKHNNQLYKSIYIPNTTSSNNLINKKRCRILINNLLSLEGLLQLNALGGSNNPKYYSCVFFSNNVSWSAGIGKTLLKDLGGDVAGDGWDNIKGTDTGIDIELKEPNIKLSWGQNDATTITPFGGAATTNTTPVVYPVVSYGEYNPGGETGTLQLWEYSHGSPINDGTYSGVASTGNPYGNNTPVVDWRPCLWVYDVFKKIFEVLGFSITSTFIEGDMFKRLLFALPNFKYNNPNERYALYSFESRFTNDGCTIEPLIPRSGSYDFFEVSYTGTSAGEAIDVSVIDINESAAVDITVNNSGGWNASTGVFTIKEYGFYDISVGHLAYQITVVYPSGASNIIIKDAAFKLQVLTLGAGTEWHTVSAVGAYGSFPRNAYQLSWVAFPELNIVNDLYLNKGDQVRIVIENTISHDGAGTQAVLYRMEVYGIKATNVILNCPGGGSVKSASFHYDIKLQSEIVAYGQTYNLKDIINAEYTQIDFIMGITHAFNLQYTTNEVTKTVTIEPYPDFYKPLSDAIDWTEKVDRGKEYEDKFLRTELKRRIIAKYKTDSNDKAVEERANEFWEGILDENPYYETLSDKFTEGTTILENPFFAGTYNTKDQATSVIEGDDVPYNACLWKEIESTGLVPDPNSYARPDKGYEFLPRLLYWKRYSETGVDFPTKRLWTRLWWNKSGRIVASSNSPFNFYGFIYPQATSINYEDTTSPVLSYGNVYQRDYDLATEVYTNYSITKGLYSTYYQDMIEMLKQHPRVRSIHIDLKITDIVNLDFRQLVYIDGSYWRINKIVDYQPHKNVTTKVELILFEQTGELPIITTNPGALPES